MANLFQFTPGTDFYLEEIGSILGNCLVIIIIGKVIITPGWWSSNFGKLLTCRGASAFP